MRDAWGRNIDYFRVSVTDRCNLRCFYCMPSEGIPFKAHEVILRYEEILTIAKCAASLGIKRVRVTGGEPLLRKGLPRFLDSLTRITGIEDVGITTNGVLLSDLAQDIYKAGVFRVNVSLDSLKPDRYDAITRGQKGDWKRVCDGIEQALKLGFDPVKINVVAMKGVNDDEWEHFARLTRDMPVHVRFIEIMPLGEEALSGPDCTDRSDFGESYVGNKNPLTPSLGGSPGEGAMRVDRRERALTSDWRDLFVSADEILERVSAAGDLYPAVVKGAGPAEYYRLVGARGTIGVISAISRHFCPTCNRLRMTADGKLSPCLASNEEIDIAGPLRRGVCDEELIRILKHAILSKPLEHDMLGPGSPDSMERSTDVAKEAAAASMNDGIAEDCESELGLCHSRRKGTPIPGLIGTSCPPGLSCPGCEKERIKNSNEPGADENTRSAGPGTMRANDKTNRRMSQLGG